MFNDHHRKFQLPRHEKLNAEEFRMKNVPREEEVPPSSSIIFSRILLTDDDDAGCKRDRHDATLNVRACMQDIG